MSDRQTDKRKVFGDLLVSSNVQYETQISLKEWVQTNVQRKPLFYLYRFFPTLHKSWCSSLLIILLIINKIILSHLLCIYLMYPSTVVYTEHLLLQEQCNSLEIIFRTKKMDVCFKILSADLIPMWFVSSFGSQLLQLFCHQLLLFS